MNNLLTRYFQKTKSYSLLRFIIETTFVGLAAKFIVGIFAGIILVMFFPNYVLPDQEIANDIIAGGTTTIIALFEALVIAPVLETVIGQHLPIFLTSLVTKNIVVQIIISTLVFSGLHVQPLLIVSMLPLAVILAWSFIMNKRMSWKKAYSATIGIHSLHNAIVSLLLLIPS